MEVDLNMPTSVDHAAPIVVRKSVFISAALDRVWRLHAHPQRYPEWQTSIKSVEATGPLAVGDEFTWTSYGFTVTSHVYAVQDQRRTLWGGSADGITGIHEWLFGETASGTNVETLESWSGPAIENSVNQMHAALEQSLEAWTNALKTTAETR